MLSFFQLYLQSISKFIITDTKSTVSGYSPTDSDIPDAIFYKISKDKIYYTKYDYILTVFVYGYCILSSNNSSYSHRLKVINDSSLYYTPLCM